MIQLGLKRLDLPLEGIESGQTLDEAVEMIDVKRIQRMLELGGPADPAASGRQKILPFPRHLRPPEQYALSRQAPEEASSKADADDPTDDLA